jgi:dihydroorotase
MKVLIKQARIVCPSSPFNGQLKDILITNGIIAAIADSIAENADQVIEETGLHASIGWMDVFAHFCDPGFEYRETLESGTAAAAAGGFTDVLALPNTNPAIHSKSQVEYIVQKSKGAIVNIHPVGAVTKNTEGNELAEMYDMQASGAAAFSDGINTSGLMNEGIISTQLGLPGKPAMAEELMVARDIKLARYADSKLHFTGVSSAKSLEYIKRAKEGGIKISCSVTPYHLFFCDEDLTTYDTNLKVNPPLRTAADRDALQKGLMNGTIDCIASHHIPYNYDNKVCEFEYAKNGMIGLESLFGVVRSMASFGSAQDLGQWSIDSLIEKLSVAPRKIFGLMIPEIKEGVAANLTLFNPDAEYVFEEGMIKSKSRNSAFIGKQLKGKVIGIVNNNQVVLNT